MANLEPDRFDQGLTMFESVLSVQVAQGRNPVEAAPELLGIVDTVFPGFRIDYDAYVRAQSERVENLAVGNMLRNHPGSKSWYTTPKQHAGVWPDYRRLIEARLPARAVCDIDESTTRILSRSANPHERGEKRKGLVIGYVQSGKTANYAGLIAKAVDAGYRLIIVLAGMHSNLRAQTQARLQKDLDMNTVRERKSAAWHMLTGANSDIAADNQISFLNLQGNVGVMIVKKNAKRLANVVDFLGSIPKDTRLSRAVLIIDDESDQATPNSLGGKQMVSAINGLVRDIWRETLTGTYVAYTATPFANVFIDPSDEDDLYPDDFIMTLPRPIGYMGVDTFFNLNGDADEAGDHLSIYAREISPDESAKLAPVGRDISKFEPEITPSLDRAIRWFLLATAIREIRTSEIAHSSMLLHTSHRVHAHSRLKDVVVDYINVLAANRDAERGAFEDVFYLESERARRLVDLGEEYPDWDGVWEKTYDLIGRVKVVVDNGGSSDRLAYPDDDPQVVIAIGGGTLSRGLTLEGLVVSYFLRTSNTYDTLLQMGRWFGFRPRYADLARVWATPGLLEDYRHLALVEADLREDVADMDAQGKIPRQYAVRVRAHPGRLAIAAPGKMWAAEAVHVGLGGTRHQGTILDKSPKSIRRGQEVARDFIREIRATASHVFQDSTRNNGSTVIAGVTTQQVTSFLSRFHSPVHGSWLAAEAVAAWTKNHRDDASWNVVLVAGRQGAPAFEFDDGLAVRVAKRAPVTNWAPSEKLSQALGSDSAPINVRALMSGGDWLLDLELLAQGESLDPAVINALEKIRPNRSNEGLVKDLRRTYAPTQGVITLYAVDKDSQPDKTTKASERVALEADDHIVAIGIVYPHSDNEYDNDYYAVRIDVQDEENLDEDVEIVDNEGDYEAVIE